MSHYPIYKIITSNFYSEFKSQSLYVPELCLVEPNQNVAAVAAARDPVVAALGLVGGRADGTGNGAPVRPAIIDLVASL